MTTLAPPRLLYLVNEDFYFLAHRLPMARAAMKDGYEVHVATRVSSHRDTIEAHGIRVHNVDIKRGSINPLNYLRAVRAVRLLCRSIRPTIVHHVTLQASLIGALASRGLPVAQINTITGLGSVFTSDATRYRLARPAVTLMMSLLLNGRNSIVTVENADHKTALVERAVAANSIHVLPGSGVDLSRYAPLAPPQGTVTVGFAGRMLEDKGVRTLIEAYKIARQRGHRIDLMLAGLPDPSSRNSIPAAELQAWSRLPGIRWLGHVEDIRTVWERCHVVALPSLGEGLPMSLLEAAACGRPLVATDVAGCREVVRPDFNGTLVPVKDATRLAEAMMELADDPQLRTRYGAAGRSMVEAEYSAQKIEQEILRVYALAAGKAAPGTAAYS